jgi:hypothetical protein
VYFPELLTVIGVCKNEPNSQPMPKERTIANMTVVTNIFLRLRLAFSSGHTWRSNLILTFSSSISIPRSMLILAQVNDGVHTKLPMHDVFTHYSQHLFDFRFFLLK